MTKIEQVICEAIELADEHRPQTGGEALENFRNRRAAYVLTAIEEATGIPRSDLEKLAARNADYVMDMPAPRLGPMFG